MRLAAILLAALFLAGCTNEMVDGRVTPTPTQGTPTPSPSPTATTTATTTPSAATPTPTPSPTPTPTATPTPSGPITREVAIFDFQYSPATTTIPLGSTVHWVNADSSGHTVTSDAGSAEHFDSGRMATDADFSHTFNATGTFGYHCAFHGDMTATITVA